MARKNKIMKLEKWKNELIRNIENCNDYKNEVIKVGKNLKDSFNQGFISHEEYYRRVSKGKHDEWLDYYDNSIKHYKKKLIECKREIYREEKKLQLSPVISTIIILTLIGLAVFIIRPEITGFTIGEGVSIGEEKVGVQEIGGARIERTYSTEKVVREGHGTITQYFYPKFPIFNGSNYYSWEEGVKYEKTTDGIRIITLDGLDCSAKWKLSDKEITGSETETVKLEELNAKKLKHEDIKDLRISYSKEVNETSEECDIVEKENCESENSEDCIVKENCHDIIYPKSVEEYIDSSRFNIDSTKGEISLIDKSISSEINEVKIEYNYYNENKNINLDFSNIKKSKNKLEFDKGVLSDLKCSSKGVSVSSVEQISGDIYKVGHYLIDLDPSFYYDVSGDWLSGTFDNTTVPNGDIILAKDITNLTLMGSYTSTAGTGSINGADAVYVSQSNNGEIYAYVTSWTDSNLAIINVTNPNSIDNISAGYTDTVPPNSIENSTAVYVKNHTNKDIYAYVTGFTDDSVTVINVTNPAAPAAVGDAIHAGIDGVTGVSTWTYSSNSQTFIFATGANIDTLESFNATDPTKVGLGTNGTYADSAGAGSIDGVQGLSLVQIPNTGDVLAVAASYIDDYLTVINISNPTAFTATSGAPSVTNAGLDGAMAPFAFTYSNNSVVAFVPRNLTEAALTLVDITAGYVTPVIMSTLNISTGATPSLGASWVDVKQHDNGDIYAYVASSNQNTMTIVNTTNMNAPSIIAQYTNSAGAGSLDQIRGLFSLGNYTYTTSFGDSYVNVMNINPFYAAGTYISNISDAGSAVHWDSITWSETEPTSTDVQLQFRSCNDAVCDTETWSGYNDTSPGDLTNIPNNQYFQYMAIFTTTDSSATPVLSWVNISYSTVNTAPSNPTLILNSTTSDQQNYTNETLACNFLCNDADVADTLTYDIDWIKDGVTSVRFTSQSCGNPSYNSPQLTDDNTTKNDLWSCSINITDNGGLSSNTIFSENVTINNYPPSIPDLNLPIDQKQIEADIFTVELNWSNVSNLDPDLDSYAYYLEIWNESAMTNLLYVNSSISETTNTTSDLVTFPSESADYFWQVLSNDTANSSWSELRNISFYATPTNTAPSEPTGILLNSTLAAQTNLTNENLAANFLCSDPDTLDTLTYDIYFYKEGIYNQSMLTISCTDPEYVSYIFDESNTSKGENWSFSVNVTDVGGLSSPTVFSDNLTIENSAPEINYVSLNNTIAPFDGGLRKFEFSFVANDNDTTNDLDDTKAIANVSLSTDNYLNSSCYAEGDVAGGRNYSCTIEMQYYWNSGSWNYATEIQDDSGIAIQNSTSDNSEVQTWFYSELAALNLSVSALTWVQLVPSETNQTATSNPIVIENTGNKAVLNIFAKAIDLIGASGKYIPAANFTIGNITSASQAECDYTNQTSAVTPGVKPLIFMNNTNIYPVINTLARGQGSNNNLYYCLFDVPANLQSESYTTQTGTEWDINVE